MDNSFAIFVIEHADKLPYQQLILGEFSLSVFQKEKSLSIKESSICLKRTSLAASVLRRGGIQLATELTN